MSTNIVVVNESTVVTDDQVKAVVAALQIQLDRDFSPIWEKTAKLSFQTKGLAIPVGYWELVILDNSDQAGALGYHELTVNGDPIGKVFAKEDLQYGTSWSVTASHELLEMMGDPNINLVAENDSDTAPIFYAYENCDACEDDQYGYKIGDILVSDFVCPSWFNVAAGKAPFDFGNHISKPLQLLTNGYISILDASNQNGWTQITGRFESRDREMRAAPKEGHRRYRRMISRKEWRKSDH